MAFHLPPPVTSLLAAVLLLAAACSDSSGSAPDLASERQVLGDSLVDLPAEELDLTASDALSRADQLGGEAVPRPDVFVQSTPSLGNVTLLVNLGDSIAAGYGVPQDASYCSLLLANDDPAYPDFAGKDLGHLFPGISFADLAWPGATSDDLLDQLSDVPENPSGQTLVLISAGGNDLLFNYIVALDPQQARAMAQEVTAQIQKVVAHFSDTALYPGGATIVIMNVYDPSDGMGSFPQNAPVTGTCAEAAPYLSLVGDVLLQSLEAFNQEIASFVLGRGEVLLADLHALFLGHGFQHENPASFFYVPEDPSLWFALDCIHPNIQGHEAIRRLLWRILLSSP